MNILKTIYERIWVDVNLLRRREWSIIKRLLNPAKNDKICDIGSGGGIFGYKLAQYKAFTYGVDLNMEDVRRANKYNKTNFSNFIQGNAENLPFKKNSFNKIISVCALEHFSNDGKAFSEMNSILKNNGLLAASVDSFSYNKISDELKKRQKIQHSVVNFYDTASLKKKLKMNGFKLEKSEYIFNSLFSHFLVSSLIRLKYNRLILLCFFLFYPLCLASDKLFGKHDEGYILVFIARKIKIS